MDMSYKFLIISIVAIAMFSTIIAAISQSTRTIWKKCRKCGWWYDDDGNLSTRQPNHWHGDYGLCANCSNRKR